MHDDDDSATYSQLSSMNVCETGNLAESHCAALLVHMVGRLVGM